MSARTVYIVTRMRNCEVMSYDLYILALFDVLTSLGMTVVFLGDEVNIHSLSQDANAIFFFCGVQPHNELRGVDPPPGLKVHFNNEILPYRSKAQRNTFGITKYPVEVRAVDLRHCAKAIQHWIWIKKTRIDRSWIDVVFDFSPLNVEFLKTYGIKAFWCPSGYHERFEFDRKEDRSNEVITFLGHVRMQDTYRISILEKVQKSVKSQVRFGGNVGKKNGGGIKRNDVADYFVSLSLGRSSEWGAYPDLRMMLLGSNRCTVVMDRSDYMPLPKDTVIERSSKEIWKGCRHALTDHSYGDRLYAFMKTSYRFEDHLRRAMEMAGIL